MSAVAHKAEDQASDERAVELIDIAYRPGTPEDAEVAGQLLRSALGRYTFMLGCDDPATLDRDLSRLFAHPRNRFSYRYALIAEAHGRICGVMLSYPHEVLRSLMWPTAWALLRIIGPWRFFKGIVTKFDRIMGKESEPGEYHGYICAVPKQYRRIGLGTMFVLEAEKMAREQGYKKVSCTTDPEQKALQGALALGYEIVDTIEVRRGGTYHRVLKVFDE